MAILKDCEIWHAKLNPSRPNAKWNKENPTWELQIRTANEAQKNEWIAASLKPKLMVGKEGEPNEGEPILNAAGKKQWRVNLKKKSITKKNEPADPVKVMNGSLEDIDPNSIGNGSIGHIRVFQYEYQKEGVGTALASILMAVQLRKHIVYIAPPRDDEFELGDTETIAQDTDDDSDDDNHEAAPSPSTKAKTPSVTPVDVKPESAF